ncbi:MAG: NAD-glutamate dehydrogenase [Deltaproteobacteria bacterium]|nr:NAD-glutamate dehydrogenase [Deltaproteobacteria bacterium]
MSQNSQAQAQKTDAISHDKDLTDHMDFGGTSSQDIEFQFEKTGEDLASYIEDIADTVRIGLDQSIAILAPWFFSNMPRMYYQTTPRAEKVRHLSAVITGHVFETRQTVELWDHDHSKVTYIGPGTDSQILINMTTKLGPMPVKMGSLYFSRDKLLFLSTFLCKTFKKADLNNQHILPKTEEARKSLMAEYPQHEAEINHYIEHLDHDFVVYATPSRLHITFRMLLHMLTHEGAHTVLEPFINSQSGRLTLGLKGIDTTEVLEQIFHLMSSYGFEILRFFTVQFDEGYAEPISVLHFILNHSTEKKIDPEHLSVIKLVKGLRTLGWVDSGDDYSQFMKQPFFLSINASNLLRAMAFWIHVLLGKENVYYYSDHQIIQTFSKHSELTRALVNLFRLKFSPLREEERLNGDYQVIREALFNSVNTLIDLVERHIFKEAIRFTDNVLKTNYFLPTKTGLAFRLSPEVLDSRHYPQSPFGIFFIIGRDYRFFQVRWKDVARGGLRIVMPGSMTDYGYAIAGLFDEVYGLSHAQQLKNKDIPEGGSKAVMILKPGGNKARVVRGGINALLDLLVPDDEIHDANSRKKVSYYDKEEIIYLGPDENMTNDLIEWVPKHAAKRGFPYAEAFISSKPGAGINHKEYGVTSEGLHVFLDHTLKFLGIYPEKEPFTIKMTGGPDGDVAGNELRILHREYGENARVVAIADGFGAAYDPEGLAWDELLRLITAEKSICEFSRSCLSKHPEAWVIEAKTREDIQKRNNLHATAIADIFIPAGGRPYTVHKDNCDKFISESGEPTCRAIIEGANIFFTKDAREKLQELGIIMIKDSSANKTGVICSSYEIIASLLLNQNEFQEIKTVFIAQVIDILREKARKEAVLLFNEHNKHRGSKTLVELSMDISREINQVTDTLLDEISSDKERYLKDPTFRNLILRHCPAILRETYPERILEKLPEPHQIAILASFIASHIIYSEGLGWLESISEGQRFRAALTYMKNDQLAASLIEKVRSSGIEDNHEIAAILARSAARDLTMINLEGGSFL